MQISGPFSVFIQFVDFTIQKVGILRSVMALLA